ncbi:MAG: PAS domain S-box protein [Bacteroidetes bacterium]|nr:PAS domain S-box protein [Bacteroidota bacterium]
MITNPVLENLQITNQTADSDKAKGIQKEALEILQKIASRVPGVVYQYRLRPDGSSCFPYASEAMSEIYRVSPDEVCEDASKVAAILHPDDLAGVLASIEVSARELSPWQHEYRVKFDDGTIRTLYGNAVPQKEEDGSVLWHGFITDITKVKKAEEIILQDNAERKKSQIALQESELRYRTLFKNSPSGILVLDEKGIILETNDTFAATTLYSLDELIGKDVRILTAPENSYSVDVNIQRILAGEIIEQEVFSRRKNGTYRILLLREIAITLPNGNPGILSVSNDISERKKAEQEIKQKNQELLNINAEKDKFFSIIAHDLRGPFNTFLGLTRVMAEELPTLTMNEIQKFAATMEISATNLFRLLENLLQWATIQRGFIPFNQEALKLDQVIKETLDVMLEPAKRKGIGISVNIPDGMNIFADRNILQSVIRNLLSNAIKFTPGGGTINISAKPSSHKNIEIAIKDSGIGMSREIIDNLFGLAVQTNRLGTDGELSTGLGLILCKDFIEKHGEKIWAESEEGNGSTFYFTIPSIDLPGNEKKTVFNVSESGC